MINSKIKMYGKIMSMPVVTYPPYGGCNCIVRINEIMPEDTTLPHKVVFRSKLGERAAEELRPNMLIFLTARLKTIEVCTESEVNFTELETFIDVIDYRKTLLSGIATDMIVSLLDPEELNATDKVDPLRHQVLPPPIISECE